MSIADKIGRIEDSLASSCARVNRDPSEITLVAVSKQKSIAQIIEAADAGLKHFGENRVEEGRSKIGTVNEAASTSLTWHMVGHVQSRKAKLVLPLFDLIQSIDSVKLARKMSGLADARDTAVDVLLEINISGEASKYGFRGYNWYCDSAIKEQLWREFEYVTALPRLNLNGLMTMAPFGADADSIRRVFADLYRLREELSSSFKLPLDVLSMGMTDDYEIAIEEGANMLRIGRAVFGERQA